MKICIDPGHGEFDPGASGPTGLKEKDVVLKVALKVENLLRARGIKTYMSRRTDVFIQLQKRAKLANDVNADIFISIHCNGFRDSTVKGSETFTRRVLGPKTKKLAQDIQDELAKIVIPNRGVKHKNYTVLWLTKMPAILVECDFITNPDREALLKTEQRKDDIAEAIVKGVCKYLGIVNTGAKIYDGSIPCTVINFCKLYPVLKARYTGQSVRNDMFTIQIFNAPEREKIWIDNKVKELINAKVYWSVK